LVTHHCCRRRAVLLIATRLRAPFQLWTSHQQLAGPSQ
jgi:hypothetical protein